MAATLAITYWAAKRSRSAQDFYAAGSTITGWQNGLAIAGDSMSAGAFLGLSALVYANGFDGLVYAVGYTVGFPIVLFLIAERLRNLGRFTFADVVCYRLNEKPLRVFSALASLTIVAFYLIAQLVGAGQLIKLLFNIDYIYAEMLIGALMIIYVMFGGMLATTWVQIVKAILLLVAGTLLACMVMAKFGFSYDSLLKAAVDAHPQHSAILAPRALAKDPISAASLALALLFGTTGLPHILMRFFTVPDARSVRASVLWAASAIGYFYALIFIIGFGTLALVAGNQAYLDGRGQLLGGGNMAAIHLSDALGGPAMLGFTSAVAFATILAVVAGLTLAGASSISHDLYARSFGPKDLKEKTEVFASRIATLGVGIAAVALGIAFEKQNVAYMISLVYGIAASTTFPLLLLTVYWKPLTTAGALAGGIAGLCSSLGLTILGPAIWVKTLGFSAAVFPIDPPTLVSLPLAFCTCIVVSLLDKSYQGRLDQDKFNEQNDRAMGLRAT